MVAVGEGCPGVTRGAGARGRHPALLRPPPPPAEPSVTGRQAWTRGRCAGRSWEAEARFQAGAACPGQSEAGTTGSRWFFTVGCCAGWGPDRGGPQGAKCWRHRARLWGRGGGRCPRRTAEPTAGPPSSSGAACAKALLTENPASGPRPGCGNSGASGREAGVLDRSACSCS